MDVKSIIAALERFGPALALLNPALAALPASAIKAASIGQTLLDIGADVKDALDKRANMEDEEDIQEIERLLAEIAAANDVLGAAIDES